MSDQPGYYCGTYQGASTDTNNKKSTPFLLLRFTITHVAQNGGWAPVPQTFDRPVKYCISDGVWNSAMAKDILVRNLHELGFNGNFAAPEFASELLQGNVTLQAEADGEYTNWKIDGLSGPRERKPVENTVARTLNARYQAAASTVAPPAGAPEPPQVPPVPAPEPDLPPGGDYSPPPLTDDDAPAGGDNIPF